MNLLKLMKVTRRNVLKSSLIGGLASIIPGLCIPQELFAQDLIKQLNAGMNPGEVFAANSAPGPVSNKALICLFLRGGNDGLNTVVPTGDPAYYDLRPTLAVRENDVLDIGHPILGFNRRLAGLKSVYDAGGLAVFPATWNQNLTRSHFKSQDMLNTGLVDDIESGWLNRSLLNATIPAADTLNAVSLTHSTHELFKGQYPVTTFNNISSLVRNLDFNHLDKLTQFYGASGTNNHAYVSQIKALGLNTFKDVKILKDIDQNLDLGANYPNTTIAKQLKTAAALIKSSSVKALALDRGGFDTHNNQRGGHDYNWQQLSEALAAFYEDIKGESKEINLLVMSEFGRTMKENASRGTDHGKGNCWFVLGNKVKGGVYGGWPGLKTEQLLDNRYLDYSVDIVDIVAELVEHHFALNPTQVFQNISSKKVGFVA
jgi:uncharacterized protein (DUF1501 family)